MGLAGLGLGGVGSGDVAAEEGGFARGIVAQEGDSDAEVVLFLGFVHLLL